MDPNEQSDNNQNLNSGPAGQPSVDGFISPRVSMGDNTPSPAPVNNTASVDQQLSNAFVSKPEKNKKALVVILAILFILAAGGAGYMYTMYNTAKKDLDRQKAAATTLQASLDDAQAASAVDTTALEVQTEYADELSALAAQLKTLCGTACASVVIPTIPTPTPTPTSTPTPTPSVPLEDI